MAKWESSRIADHGRGGLGPPIIPPTSIRQPEPVAIASPAVQNANIGASLNASDAEEVNKLKLAVKYGADTVMDLSTGGVNLDEVRTAIIERLRCRSHGPCIRRWRGMAQSRSSTRMISCTSSRSTASRASTIKPSTWPAD